MQHPILTSRLVRHHHVGPRGLVPPPESELLWPQHCRQALQTSMSMGAEIEKVLYTTGPRQVGSHKFVESNICSSQARPPFGGGEQAFIAFVEGGRCNGDGGGGMQWW